MDSDRNVGIRLKTSSDDCSNNLVIPISNDDISDFDKIIYAGGIKIVVKKKDYPEIKNMTVDYEKSFLSGKFRFINSERCHTCNDNC